MVPLAISNDGIFHIEGTVIVVATHEVLASDQKLSTNLVLLFKTS